MSSTTAPTFDSLPAVHRVRIIMLPSRTVDRVRSLSADLLQAETFGDSANGTRILSEIEAILKRHSLPIDVAHLV